MTQKFKTARAEQYANGKSSASVFRENHIKDYLAGYEQALEDTHAPEMLERLNEQNIDLKILKENLRIAATFDFRLEGYSDQVQKWIDANNELITKATTI